MKKKSGKLILLTLLLALIVVLGACANTNDETQPKKEETENMDKDANSEEDMAGTDHSNMEMSSSGEVPEGLKVAENPTYKVGSKAIINADHMEGMKGAEASIAGAYDTTVYAISYTPTTGGERVENHK
ncbi:MAG: YdhK family protein, partial [Bacillus sp. (in: Bacteria)]|nr:YdhK family protein [Bacillus sp. (in: firmicutes)]